MNIRVNKEMTNLHLLVLCFLNTRLNLEHPMSQYPIELVEGQDSLEDSLQLNLGLQRAYAVGSQVRLSSLTLYLASQSTLQLMKHLLASDLYWFAYSKRHKEHRPDTR